MNSHRERAVKKGKSVQKKIEHIEEKQILSQPKQSYAIYEDNAKTDNDTKDFEFFVAAPISLSGQFIFKSEKNWSADVSGCFEYFTLDLRLFSAAMKCVPFNQCVRINDEYFTADQLTNFHNIAEEGKEAYKAILSSLESSKSSNIITSKVSLDNESKKQPEKNSIIPANVQDINDDSDNFDDDLDFLLSLKSPVVQNYDKEMTLTNVSNNVVDLKTEPGSLMTKPTDLESWLDTLLED